MYIYMYTYTHIGTYIPMHMHMGKHQRIFENAGLYMEPNNIHPLSIGSLLTNLI